MIKKLDYKNYSMYHQNKEIKEIIDEKSIEKKLDSYLDIFSEFYARLRAIKRFNLPDENKEYYKRTLYKPNEEEKLVIDALDILRNRKNIEEVDIKNRVRVEYLMSNIDLEEEEESFRIGTNDSLTNYYIQIFNDFREKIDQDEEQNNRLIVINLVSILELFINQILEFNYLYINKGWHDVKNRTITYTDILEHNNINDLRQSMIDRIILDLNYKNFQEIMNEVKKVCFKNVENHQELFKSRVESVNEIYYTRNIITHNNGIINQTFMEKVPSTIYKEGEQIKVNENFLKISTEAIMELGMEIFSRNIYSKKLFKYRPFRDNIETKGISIMNDGELKASRILFYYMRKFYKNKNEDFSVEFMPNFNYWLTFRLDDNISGRKSEVLTYFNGLENINSLSTQMELGKSALLDDEEVFLGKAIEFLNDNFRNENSLLINTLRWPIFKIVENQNKFIEFREQLLYNIEEQ